MMIARSKDALAQYVAEIKGSGQTIGFVPTMGALHDGHLGLMRIAADHADIVAVSIYVNRTQFAPNEDFDSYPRDVDGDLAKLESVGVGLVYLPTEEDMYPNGKDITTLAGSAAKGLESDFRPHFFDGVATVVKRLFDHVQPDIAVFGEKDFQQLQVIREMVEAENMPVQIIGGPTARDDHGLALSSRNAYLSDTEMDAARLLNRILADIAQTGGANDNLIDECKKALQDAGFDKIDYVSVKPEWNRVLAAAWLGKTRLIDNMALAS